MTPTEIITIVDRITEEIYTAYLQACMAWADEEDARYNRFILRFNDAYQRYARLLMDERVRYPRMPLRF